MIDSTTKKRERKGVLLCFLSALCFSLSPITGKLLFTTGLPWQVVVACRIIIPAILIFCYDIIFKREVFRINKRDIPFFILNGFFFGCISICHYCALYYIDAAVATVLLNTNPIWTVILSRMVLREKISTPKIIAMICCFTGITLIIQLTQIQSISADSITSIFGIPSSVFGIVIALLAGLLSALYTICTRKLNSQYPGWTVNSWCFMMAVPIFLVVGVPKIAAFSWTGLHFLAIFVVALIGLAAYSLYALSMQYIEAGKASLLVTLDPVFSVTMSVFILGEHLFPSQILGCVLVFIGIILMEVGQPLMEKIRYQRKKDQDIQLK